MSDFAPGRPLPTELSQCHAGRLYHHALMPGRYATMLLRQEDGRDTWSWRHLRAVPSGAGPDHGSGSWKEMVAWLGAARQALAPLASASD